MKWGILSFLFVECRTFCSTCFSKCDMEYEMLIRNFMYNFQRKFLRVLPITLGNMELLNSKILSHHPTLYLTAEKCTHCMQSPKCWINWAKYVLSLETPVFGCTAPPIKHEQALVRSMHWKIALERLS